MLPSAYVEHLLRGPFPGRIDPWAEAAHYFQQIHSGMIEHLLTQLQVPLLQRGYLVGKETSLQVADNRSPDLFVRQGAAELAHAAKFAAWDYDAAAEAVLAEIGVMSEMPELQALVVTDVERGDLVTIVEIVSPKNKRSQADVDLYRSKRNGLVNKGVNAVEIDPTRSNIRALVNPVTEQMPYYIAVFLPIDPPRTIASGLHEPLKRFALPLRQEVFPTEANAAYHYAYRQSGIAAHLVQDAFYTLDNLPFPSLLSDDARREALAAVEAWQTELARLREGGA